MSLSPAFPSTAAVADAVAAASAALPERVTLAMDGRASSDAALRWTVRRAASRPVTVHVVAVVPRDRPFADRAVRTRQLTAERVLHHAESQLRSVLDARSITMSLEAADSPIEVILGSAAPSDLLVVGTDNATRTPVFHHPSMAVRVAAASPVDVVVVPAGWRADAGSGVVAGVHGEDCDHRSLDAAADEARAAVAPLTLVHSWDQPSVAAVSMWGSVDVEAHVDTRRRVLCRVADEVRDRRPGLVVRALLTAHRPSRALLDAARDAEMLVVGAHVRGTVGRALLGSTAHAVLARIVCPTRVVRSTL